MADTIEVLKGLENQIGKLQTKYESEIKEAGTATEEVKKELQVKMAEFTETAKKEWNIKQEQLDKLEVDFKKFKEDKSGSVQESFQELLEKAMTENGNFEKIRKGIADKGTKESIVIKVAGNMTSTASFTGAVVNNPYYPGIVAPIKRKMHVRDLIPKGTMTGNAVPYIVNTGQDGAPTYVVESAQKPQVDYDFALKSAPAAKIAAWANVTEEMFADVPALASYISSQMILDLLIVEDNKLLYGAGSGDILGITAQVGFTNIEADAFGTAIATPNTPQAILSALAVMAAGNKDVTAMAMNPVDYYEMIANLANGGADVALRFVYDGQSLMVDGIPILKSTAVLADDLIVGDWSKAMLFQREGIRVQTSTEDRDNFIKNLITVLVEERLALAVFQPSAFGYGQITEIKTALAAIA